MLTSLWAFGSESLMLPASKYYLHGQALLLTEALASRLLLDLISEDISPAASSPPKCQWGVLAGATGSQ